MLLNPSGHGAAGAYSSSYWVRGEVHPGQVARDKQHFSRVNLDSLMNLTCMRLDCVRKLKDPEETQMYTGELHTKRFHTQSG